MSTLIPACSTSAQTSLALQGSARTDDDTGATAPTSGPVCTPDVGGLVLAGISSIKIGCPHGYTPRQSLAALPIAGRFKTLDQLTDAFCTLSSDADPTAPIELPAPPVSFFVDFETSDVVAYAYDAHAETIPALYKRGEDLWLKVTTHSCFNTTPRLASVAFVVPKNKTIGEQTCSPACE